jgi:protocatechuate 3,4-dioxygenase beta subunit
MSDHDLHDRGLAFDLETIFDCDAIPGETAGPYPGDGSAGPNVLTESGVVRDDIRSSFGDSSGTAEGVPLTVVSEGIADQNYLRGVQEAGADGKVAFTTIFPAAYMGRWPHIHFEVYSSLDEATGGGGPTTTSQLALPEDACAAVYATGGHEQSVQNLAQTSLEGDMVFSDGADARLATVEGDVENGYAATLTIPV